MHDASLHEHIDHLLAALDSPLSAEEDEADSLSTPEAGPEQSCIQEAQETPLPHPRRIVNIYLDLSSEEEEEREDSEAHTVESTLDPGDETEPPPESKTPLTKSHEAASVPAPTGVLSPLYRQPRPYQRGFRLVVVSVPVLVGIGLALWSVGPLLLFAPSATITIVPVSTPISTQVTLHVVTQGVADATANELAGRLMSTVSLSQQASIPTTGTTAQEATVAHGSITFYNAAPTPQTVVAGTLITSPMGVAVVTERTVSIPAAQYPLFGQATTLAHAVLTGPTGNLPAGAIYGPCCRLNLSAVNSPFHGGQAARTYQSVSVQDRDTVLTHLKASLDESMQAVVQVQVHAGEELLHPLKCQTHSQANHQVDAEATQLSMIVSETCTGVVYQDAAFHALVMRLLSQEATRHLGAGYHQVGDITATPTTVTAKTGSVLDVNVKVSGTWAYQFGSAERAHLLTEAAGKSKAHALAILLQTPGVQSASLTIERGSTVPTDLTQIHVVVLLLM